MKLEELTLADVDRLLAVVRQLKPDDETFVRAVIDRVQVEPIKHGRATIGSLLRLLEQTNGSTVLPDEIVTQLNAPEPMPVAPVIPPPVVTSQYLRLLSNHPLIIGPTDGSEVLADAANVFIGYVDPDFRGWKADEPGKPTAAMSAMVYELVQDVDFAKMFCALSGDTTKLCLTQAQIKAFVKTHRYWLRAGGSETFFLFRSYGQFFVAGVRFHDIGRLKVIVRRFKNECVWVAGDRHRVVVPKLA